MAFIVKPPNTNSNENHIEPFGIHTGSLEMKFIDLKSKDLWIVKFRVEKHVGRVGDPERYGHNSTKVNSFKRKAASSGTDIRRME